MLTLCCGRRVVASGFRGEMQTKEPPDFSVEVHLTSLDAGPEQCALTYFENSSRQSQAIRVHESANTNMVADFDFCHDPLFRKRYEAQSGIMRPNDVPFKTIL